jgi:hypothetical protein
MGINLKIKRRNLQSEIRVRCPTLENQIQQFSKTHNHFIEHSDSDKATSRQVKKNTT